MYMYMLCMHNEGGVVPLSRRAGGAGEAPGRILFFDFYTLAPSPQIKTLLYTQRGLTRVSHEFIPRILAREKPAGKL